MALQWDEVEKWLRQQSRQINWDSLKDSRWVEDFLSNFVPNQDADKDAFKGATHAQRWEIKEGKDVLEVTYPLPYGYDPEDLILYVREDCVRIEGLPNEKSEIIRLPKLVKARVCKAKIEDNKLNIRLLKRAKSTKFYTHTITF